MGLNNDGRNPEDLLCKKSGLLLEAPVDLCREILDLGERYSANLYLGPHIYQPTYKSHLLLLDRQWVIAQEFSFLQLRQR